MDNRRAQSAMYGEVPVAIGDVIGNCYEIRAEIADTETGSTFLAFDTELARQVALKVGWRGQPVGTVAAEARRCARVHDRCAAAIHHVGMHREVDFAVAEYLHGRPLNELLGNALSPVNYLKRFRQVVAGVAAAHEAGIAMTMLPAQTMFQCGDGRVVFGRLSLSQLSALGPQAAYLTPEIASGVVKANDPLAAEAGDLYHLGCFAIELARGAPPFEGSYDQQKRAHAYDQPPGLGHLRADLPGELADLVAWLLDKEPAARPFSAADVLAQLDAVIERFGGIKSGLRVLVVDTDSVRNRWLCNLAKRAVSTALVESALEGTEAAHKLNRDQPDLVIVDARLAGVMNALELCMYAKGLRSGERTQLVVFGNVSESEQAVFASTAARFVIDDIVSSNEILDIIRRAASLAIPARVHRTLVSG